MEIKMTITNKPGFILFLGGTSVLHKKGKLNKMSIRNDHKKELRVVIPPIPKKMVVARFDTEKDEENFYNVLHDEKKVNRLIERFMGDTKREKRAGVMKPEKTSTCPKCDSWSIYLRKKDNTFRCKRCKHTFKSNLEPYQEIKLQRIQDIVR